MPEKTVQKEPGKKPAPSKKPKPQQEVVVQIPLSELHPFPDHPFQVREDASMQETAESVKEYGVLVPALARPREDGGYELIAGHRRKHACELAGLATMPVIVRDIDRDAATIIMVDSNLQRENILPSERAKAYKMKMEAIKRQGARTDLTSPKISAKFRSDDEVGQDAGVSGDTIRNYIALTQLVPELQQKSEKAPALYDLTSLQRDANRVLGYTSQQTLDYLQALYEKKLCTYPRTDSRFLTDDMEGSVPGLVAAAAAVCGMEKPPTICAKQVCSSKKVTDHHAIVPTISAEKVDIASLPLGEREVLKLAARGLLRAVDEPHRYAETVITVDCAGQSFTAKGKTVLAPGWKRYEQEQAEAAPALPVVTEQQTLSVSAASVKTGKTTPPKHFTEDTLLAAMENASKEDMPDDAERKGIGTPATRSGIIEKLVSSGFVERRKSKKITNLLPTSTGTALITVLPEQLQSPQLTAEWEHRLKEIERGEIAPDSFMDGIAAMLHELVQTYKPIPGTEVLFPSGREVVGRCPRCGAEVTESPKGFFCENRDCSFVLWKNSRFFTAKKKVLTKSLAATLLKNGRAQLKGCYSEKTGKTYDAVVLLEDDGQHTGYKLVFDNG